MTKRQQLYEGKAKVIFEGPEAGTLVQYFKDDATAFNAQKKDVIKGKGMKAAVAVKPKTPIETIYPFADKLDMCLIMTVEPGFGGQSFQPQALQKITT